ncbi:MAG TPA: TolC family protein [Myxococcota bacterium]|nr:TolC family protein [Myxococcota bacterium]
MEATSALARAAALAPLALAACMSRGTQQYAAQREALERAQPAAAARAMDDPFAGTAVLSRDALVRAVLERNPGIDAARSAWRAALARYPQATALDDPMLGYNTRPRSYGADEVDAAHDVMISQALPFPGKRALRGESALAAADAARGELESERVRLAALASRQLDEAWLAERALETNARHLALLADAERVALARYTAGEGAQYDVLAAESEQGMLAQRERELVAERRVIHERINQLLHRAPGGGLPAVPAELEPLAPPDLDEAALIARALETHPELEALRATVRAGESEVALARREFLPDFTLRAAYEGTWQEDALKPGVGVEINLPLQLARRRAALDEAQARLARDEHRARRAEDRIRFEVVSAVERLREAQHLLEISQSKRIPPARNRVASARAAFAAGRASFLEFVDAERALLAAELEELEVRASLSIRRAALARALGEALTASEERP